MILEQFCYAERMTKYLYSEGEAKHISKHGIDLKLYGSVNEDIDIKRVSVEEGHFEEFKNTSWFIYYIQQGNGVFVLMTSTCQSSEVT